MKPIIRNTLAGLGLLTLNMQGMAMNNADVQDSSAPEFEFTEHCTGRYQLELPADMTLISSGYSDEEIFISVYPPKEAVYDTVYREEDRVAEWRKRVDAMRQKEIVKTGYVHENLEGGLKTLVYYADRRKLPGMAEKPDRAHSFETFMLKDFPGAEVAVAVQGQGANGVVFREEPDYKAIFRERLKDMQARADLVSYEPWPHKKAGICLNEEFTLVQNVASGHEGYNMQFFNDKKSLFELTVRTYHSEEGLKEELGRNSGLMAFLASSSMKVAGRKGRLFVSDGKYSETEREFRWVSTDTKVNSVRYAHLEIEGAIEMKDYPEMAPMKGTDVIVGLLKGVQERPYGMLDVKR